MAALNCTFASNSMASLTELWPPSARAKLETCAATSVMIRSPSACHAYWRRRHFRSLRWYSLGIQNLKNRGSGFCLSSSLVEQREFDARSLEDSTSSSSSVQLVHVPRTAADTVQEFYDLMNQRDYVGVAKLFSEDCEYQDFNFPESKKGREEILKFFQKVMPSFGTELKFVIDDMTRDDPNAVGVIWHQDWRGKMFPFTRGCSFYRCEVNRDGDQQIKYPGVPASGYTFRNKRLFRILPDFSLVRVWYTHHTLLLEDRRTVEVTRGDCCYFSVFLKELRGFARDIVEPVTKPGDVAMGVLRFVTSLFQRFPQLIDRL